MAIFIRSSAEGSAEVPMGSYFKSGFSSVTLQG
jgi:hypothetical protein